MAKYKIEKTTNLELWDEFVDKSPQGSIYSKSQFIECIEVKCAYFLVKKGEEIVGGAYMIEDDNGRLLRNLPYVPYRNSILFVDSTNVLEHKRISDQFKISELIIEFFVKHYGKHSIISSPFYIDIRPFSWFNFHEPEKGTFKVLNRFTSVLKHSIREEYLMQIRSSRRQELKKASQVRVLESNDINVLNELHQKTFERQNLKRSIQEESFLFKIGKTAIEKGFGKLLVAQIEGKLISAVLILYDNNTAYYQFGASDPDYRNSGASTKLIFESIMYAFEKLELKLFDFVGVNSPNRGDFKLSFNGDLKPYFELNFDN
jgi:lipid II:glycine glycyltransferase (peptidoglycan interpeptide bridge formation enzyme)